MSTLQTHQELTKNQKLVLNALETAKAPLSAYTLLHELREHGFRAPLQVYRALEKLVSFGLVHRLESLNAFVACQHPSCDDKTNTTVLFAICENCGNVREILSDKLVNTFEGLADEIKFSLKESVIELRGLCERCSQA